MDDVDRRLLAFAGAHRFVTAEQVEQFLRIDRDEMRERQATLVSERLIRHERVRAGQPGVLRVTSRGLAAIGSRLSPPAFDLADHRHEVGVVWLWMAGWDGAFGEAERVLSRREMQALDRAAIEDGRGAQSFAVPAGPAGDGSDRLLYPDVLMVFSWGRGAVHLHAWPHHGLDLDRRFAGHARRPEVADVVLVLVDDDRAGRRVEEAAERHGIRDRVRVQRVVGQGTALLDAASRPGGSAG